MNEKVIYLVVVMEKENVVKNEMNENETRCPSQTQTLRPLADPPSMPTRKQRQTPNIAQDANISENELNGSLHCAGIKAEIKELSVLYFLFCF